MYKTELKNTRNRNHSSFLNPHENQLKILCHANHLLLIPPRLLLLLMLLMMLYLLLLCLLMLNLMMNDLLHWLNGSDRFLYVLDLLNDSRPCCCC